jgi:hypothetical protein
MAGLLDGIPGVQNILGFGEQAANVIVPNRFLGPSELNSLFVRNLISPARYMAQMRRNGYPITLPGRGNIDITLKNVNNITASPFYLQNYPDLGEGNLLAQCTWPTIDEANAMYLRGFIDEKLLIAIYELNGVRDKGIQESFFAMRHILPGVDDLIRFAVREAFDIQIINKFQYADEIPKNIENFVAQQGLAGETGTVKPASMGIDGKPDPERPATWFDLYWFAHWELPSLTQGYDMLHRLYPNSPHGPSPDVKGGNAFVDADIDLLLKSQDIPPYWRNRLKAISYLPLTRVDVRRMYQVGTLELDEVYHAYRAIGYNDENAENLTEFTKELAEQAENKKHNAFSLKQIINFYDQGLIDRQSAINHLKELKYSEQDADEVLIAADLQQQYDTNKRMIDTVRRAYFEGQFGDFDIIDHLLPIGIKLEYGQKLVREWHFEKELKAKHISADKAVNYFKRSLIDEDELTLRLQNLNYEKKDITRIVTDARQQQDDFEEKKQEKKDKDMERLQDKLARQQKANAAEQEKLLKQRYNALIKSSTDSNLRNWLQQGLITEEEAIQRLITKNYSQADAERFVESALEKANAGVNPSHLGGNPKSPKGQGKASKPAKTPKTPRTTGETDTNIKAWLKGNIINQDTAVNMLVHNGYSRQDAIYFVAAVVGVDNLTVH